MNIAVLLTCFNRKAITIRCLDRLHQISLPYGTKLEIFLTDDRSSDDTATEVIRLFPSVHVINGSGQDFWAGGMRRSYTEALKVGFDYYLWLNDDTFLATNAISKLLTVALHAEQTAKRGTIAIGSVSNANGTTVTYGGVIFPTWWRRTTPTIVYSDTEPVPCESFNGNCVLISKTAAAIVGNLDSVFTHGLADFDYGLRAHALGVKLLVAPGSIGVCDRNPREGTYLDRNLTLAKRWKMVTSNKGFPPRPWAIFTRRHCGNLWILNWLFPYVRVILAPSLKRRSPNVRRNTS